MFTPHKPISDLPLRPGDKPGTRSPKQGLSLALALVCLTANSVFSAAWTWSGTGTWAPPSSNLLGIPTNEVPMDAKVIESPARIDLRLFKAGTYKLYRKDPAVTTWGTEVATVTVTAVPTVWSDTNVVVGELYEYGIGATTTTKPDYFGNVLAGINVDRTETKGRIAVVVAEDIPTRLPDEYAQYKADLAADGWVVHEITTPRAKDYLSNTSSTNALATILVTTPGTGYTNAKNVILSSGTATALGTITANATTGVITSVAVNYSGGGFTPGAALTFTGDTTGTGAALTVGTVTSGIAEHINIRNQLIALYNAYPGELKNVVLLGKVAVARSGVGFVGPDGHGNRASVGADAYYADMDGVWTDVSSNASFYTQTSSPTRSDAIKDGRINVAGDNKFDATYFYEVTSPNSRLELGFGRIDFSNSIPAEYESMRMYFNKLHRYKTAAADFQPGRRVCNRMNAPPTGDTVQTAMLRSMPGLVGMENIELITNTEASSSAPHVYSADEDRDSAYTRVGGPFLFYFKGSGPPDWGLNGRAVFWTGLQSHWGYWFEPGNNTMLRRLGEDNFALSYTWSIWGTDFLFHRMGMGFDIGDMMRLSLNERTYWLYNYAVTYYPTGLFMDHMGCPSLRLFMFEPPSDLSVVPTAGIPALSWTASPAVGVTGYHVYRSAQSGGPFTRITSAPVSGTTYSDTTALSGLWYYQVKAIRSETTGGGTYYNASLGIQQSIDLSNPPAGLAVSTTSLPDASWNTGYYAKLVATGGTPVFEWKVASGSLPPGLTLSPSGIVTGSATAEGTYAFTVEASDRLGQSAQKALLLTVRPTGAITFFAEANSYCGSFNTTKWSFDEGSLLMSGPVYLYQPFLRFDISSLNTNNGFVKAKLILTLDERSQIDSYALTRAALTQDAGDNWTEAGITYATRPLDNPNVPQAYASSFPVAFGTFEFDVTQLVQATLANDPAKKVGLRLYTTRNNVFGNEVRISTRYAPGNARPRLIIETTNAPAIAINSPAGNPASIAVGSALMISATATAIPAQAGSLTTQWSKLSGPGVVTFGTPAQASTTASFSAAGDYALRLTANDGLLSSTKDLTVRVLSVPAGTTHVSGPAFDPSLILRLPFDETSGTSAADASGISPPNNGTLTTIGATGNPTWVGGGKIGGAINFDGAGQRVEVNDSATTPLDGMQKLTASLWVKLNAADTNAHAILVKRTSSTSSTTSYAITLTNAEKVSVSVANKTAVVGDTTLNVGEWYHVVMLFDGSLATNNMQLYINGNPDKFGAMTTGLADNKIPLIPASKLRVGDYTATAITASFNGQVDEVRLYNRALSLDEIQVLAQAKPANLGPAIVAPASVAGEEGQAFALNASATDDGLPSPLLVGWSKQAGPGSLIFANDAMATTTATPSLAGDYTLRLTASDGDIVTFADVLASISGGATPTDFSGWALSHGLPGDGTGLGAPGATPAHDGITNAMKFALGIDPNVAGYQGHLITGTVADAGEEYLSITYVRPEPPPVGVTYEVRTCDDMSGWSTLETQEVNSTPDTPTAGLRTVIVRDTVPMATSDATRFIHLEVATP